MPSSPPGRWLVIVFMYLPAAAMLASLTDSRYFMLSGPDGDFGWWEKTLASIEIRQILSTSISMAVWVTVIAVVLAFFGAMAFARYDWRGRSIYQRIVLLPIFFPQSVLGLALLLWFNALGLDLSWKTAVFAHLVWIVPVVTLVISIQVYSFDPALEEAAFDLGATRFQVFREVTCRCCFPACSRARCSRSCCPGATFRCRSTPPAPIRPCPRISTPRWWPAIRPACPCWAPYPRSGRRPSCSAATPW
jgi:ABC-type spermidine/putrescine transport system permease subunit II